jgi:hypothetical protein
MYCILNECLIFVRNILQAAKNLLGVFNFKNRNFRNFKEFSGNFRIFLEISGIFRNIQKILGISGVPKKLNFKNFYDF